MTELEANVEKLVDELNKIRALIHKPALDYEKGQKTVYVQKLLELQKHQKQRMKWDDSQIMRITVRVKQATKVQLFYFMALERAEKSGNADRIRKCQRNLNRTSGLKWF